MRDIALTLIVFVGLIYTFKKPYIGILIWSWIGYMNPQRLMYGFALSVPYAQFTAIVTMLAIFLSKEKKTFPVTPVTIIWLLFILCMTISTLVAIYPEIAMHQLIRTYKIQLGIFLTFLVINNKERLNQLIWVIALSIGFYSIKGGLFTILTGGSARVWGPEDSYIGGNNEIGLATLMIIPLLYYLRQQVSQKWLKNTMFIFILLSLFTVLGTQSRGAFVGLAVMLFFLWLKTPNKAITGVLGTVFIVMAVAFMPSKFMERMQTIETYEQDGSAMGRINAWAVAINIANDRLFAGGFNHWGARTFAQYAPQPNDVHDAHSIYFEVLGEQGYPGLILYLLMLLLAWRSAVWVIKKTKNNEDLLWSNQLIKMIQVSLMAYCSGGAFLGLAYWDLPYHLFAIIVITRVIVEKHLAAHPEKNSVQNNNRNSIEKRTWAWKK